MPVEINFILDAGMIILSESISANVTPLPVLAQMPMVASANAGSLIIVSIDCWSDCAPTVWLTEADFQERIMFHLISSAVSLQQ